MNVVIILLAYGFGLIIWLVGLIIMELELKRE